MTDVTHIAGKPIFQVYILKISFDKNHDLAGLRVDFDAGEILDALEGKIE